MSNIIDNTLNELINAENINKENIIKEASCEFDRLMNQIEYGASLLREGYGDDDELNSMDDYQTMINKSREDQNNEFKRLCTSLQQAVKDDLYAEPDEYGVNMTPIDEILFGFDYKPSKELVSSLAHTLSNYDIIYIDPSTNIINKRMSNNTKAAVIMQKMIDYVS